MSTPKEVIGYMCLTDFNYELGTALGGIPVYSSLEDLVRERGCVLECGIAKIEVSLINIVQNPDYSKYSKTS